MSDGGTGPVAAIALDSAEWSLLERLLAEGALPHLAALLRRSAVARLHHDDYRTGLAWEHVLTGRGAAGSGRWSVVEVDPTSYGVTKLGARPQTTFFESVPGPVVSFDVPYLSLADAGPSTTAVTAWGGHDPAYPRASHPAGVLRELEAELGPHPAFANDYEIVWHRPEAQERLADALVVGARRRADACLWLLGRTPGWRLFLTVLSETHPAGEALWHGVAPDFPVNAVVDPGPARRRLLEVHRAVDDALGRLVAGLPEDTTFVVYTPQGVGTNDADVSSMVLLPELLHRLAFGRPFLQDPDQAAWAAAGRPPLLPGPDQTWHDHVSHSFPDLAPGRRTPRDRLRSGLPRPVLDTYRRGRRAMEALRTAPAAALATAGHGDGVRLGALGIPIEEETTATPADIGVPVDDLDWQVTCRYRHRWPSMPAFAVPTFYDGRIRVNLEGRERDGVVPLDGYRAELARLERALHTCRDVRTGQPVVAEVVRLREDDPLASGGPEADLQVIWSHPVDALAHPDAGTIGPFPYRRTGGHRAGGFALVAGPGIEPGDLGDHPALAVSATLALLAGGDPSGCEAPPLPLRRV